MEPVFVLINGSVQILLLFSNWHEAGYYGDKACPLTLLMPHRGQIVTLPSCVKFKNIVMGLIQQM